METLISYIVYGAFAIGYVLIISLTERSATRYVAGGFRAVRARTSITLVAPAARRTPGLSPARTAHVTR